MKSLRTEKDEQSTVIEGLKAENKRLRDQAVQHQEEQKEAQRTIAELTEKVKDLELKTMDVSKFMDWGWEQIHFWFMSVEEGRFKKYEAVLQEALSKADLEGEDLLSVNPVMIKVWGIKDRKDRMALNGHIQGLVQQNGPDAAAQVDPKANVNEGAPTAFL